MSSFKLQRLANRFPLWTKLRADPSSMGQRFFQPLANYLDFAEAELLRIRDEFNLHKWHMGHEKLYTIFLESDDYVTFDTAAGGALIPVLPTSVVGTHATLGLVSLTLDEDLEALLYGEPERLELQETVPIVDLEIWNSATPGTINTFSYPERLTISISGSTDYKKKTSTGDRQFSGYTGIVLEGRDINGTKITANVKVRDDGVYTTRDIWSKLDEAPAIDGFDGSVVVGYPQASFSYVLDPYHIGVLDDVEGPLKLRLDTATPSKTFLSYFTDRFKLGSAYRNGTVEIDNEEPIVDSLLRSSANADYVGVDLAISHENTMLYVIDDGGILHVYDHGFSSFGPPSEATETRSTRVGLQALKSYVKLDATEPMWTFYRRPQGLIESVQIKRITPSSVTEYLQANLTWSVTPYTHPGVLTAQLAEDSWNDLRFDVTYDELGEWEFYVTAVSNSQTFVYRTAVMVDSQVALASIDTGIANPTGLFFTEAGELCVTDATNFYKFTEHRDRYFIDAERQQIILRENYTSVEVTP